MQMPMSPLERSRQLLKMLDLEEKKNNDNNTIGKQNANIASEEGVSPKVSSVRPLITQPDCNKIVKNPLLKLDKQDIVNGIILSEILGKPVSRRRVRW